jgi:hypothetical protein
MKIENSRTLKDILNEWDLLSVVSYNGDPQDEYDWFSEQIAEILKKNISLADLENYLETQITDHFGLNINDTIKKNIKKYSAEIMMRKLGGTLTF